MNMRPLQGVRVLDLTTINPFTTTEFSDYGAEVIKVERPGSGDTIRDYPPFQGGVSVYHCYTDRGKKSITLNLRSPEGQAILKELVKEADVVIENFKTGTMEKMGLGYEELSAINPALVYGKLSSYGSQGPLSGYIAYDIAVQAQTGILDATGDPDGEPNRVGCYVSDHLSCTYLGTAIVMALYHAKKTGEGQRVESSMYGSVLSVMGEKVASLNAGGSGSRTGHEHDSYAPYDIYSTDNGNVALAITTDAQWQAFCQGFGFEFWADYKLDKRQAVYLDTIRPAIVSLLAPMSCKDFLCKCNSLNVPAAPVFTMEQAMDHPHMGAHNMLPTIFDQRIGAVASVGKTIRFGTSKRAATFKTAPLLGQHNADIIGDALSRLNIAQGDVATQLASLEAQGVI